MSSRGKRWKLSPEVLARRESFRNKTEIYAKTGAKLRGRKRTKIQKVHISLGTRRAMARPEVKVKLGSGRKGKPSWNKGLTKFTHPSLATLSVSMQQVRKNKTWVSNRGLNYVYNPEVARRQSKTYRERYALGLIRQHPESYVRVWYTSKDGRRVPFKSSYEAEFAKLLDRIDAVWVYEPMRFKLSNGGSYTPDFAVEIPDRFLPVFGHKITFVEVKGWWRPGAKKKFRLFLSNYPSVPIHVVGESQMNEIKIQNKIANKHRLTSRESAMKMQMDTKFSAQALSLGYTPGGSKKKKD